MSKASQRRAARGERWLVVDRPSARRVAFEQGMKLCANPAFREALIAGAAPNWHGMAILTKPEKARVRADVLAFASASEAERRQAFLPPKKKTFVEKVKQAYRQVVGA